MTVHAHASTRLKRNDNFTRTLTIIGDKTKQDKTTTRQTQDNHKIRQPQDDHKTTTRQSQDYGERQDKDINIFVYFFFPFIYSIVGCIGFSAVAN
jgi:hypothetical protein